MAMALAIARRAICERFPILGYAFYCVFHFFGPVPGTGTWDRGAERTVELGGLG